MSAHRNPIRFLVRVAKSGLSRVIGLSWLSVIFYERDLSHTAIPSISSKTPVERVVGNSEYLKHAEDAFPPAQIAKFRQRLAESKVWVLALIEDKIAYSSWISFSDELETGSGLLVKVSPGQAYIYNSYTVPTYRGIGLHTLMSAYQLQLAKELGATKVLGIVHVANVPARHVWSNLGFEEKRLILSIRLFGRICHISRSI